MHWNQWKNMIKRLMAVSILLTIICASWAMDERRPPRYLDPLPKEPQAEQSVPNNFEWTTKQKIVVGGLATLGVAAVAAGVKLYSIYQQNRNEATAVRIVVGHLSSAARPLLCAVEQLETGGQEAVTALLTEIRAYALNQGLTDAPFTKTREHVRLWRYVIALAFLNEDRFVKWGVYNDQIPTWVVSLEKLYNFLNIDCSRQLQIEERYLAAISQLKLF